jgi:hypothetical protein
MCDLKVDVGNGRRKLWRIHGLEEVLGLDEVVCLGPAGGGGVGPSLQA